MNFLTAVVRPAVLAILLAAGTGCATSYVVRDVQQRMVELRVMDEDKMGVTAECGTGMIVASNAILTANHVAEKLHPGLRVSAQNAAWAHFDLSATTANVFVVAQPNHHYDVALLVLKEPRFNTSKFESLAWMRTEDFLDHKEGFVVGFHQKCNGDKDSTPPGSYARPVDMTPPRKVEKGAFEQIGLNANFGNGYSGSMLVSQPSGAVIGVYTAGVDKMGAGEGYATSLEKVAQLLGPGSELDSRVERARPLPDRASITASLEAYDYGMDEYLERSALSPVLSGRYALSAPWVPASTLRVWPMGVAEAQITTWNRKQVVFGYGAQSFKEIERRSMIVAGLAPSLGIRMSFWIISLDVDGLGPSFLWLAEKDASTHFALSIVPTVTAGFRIVPASTDQPSSFSISPTITVWPTRLTIKRATVEDFDFDQFGNNVPFNRPLQLPNLGLRLGIQVTL